MLTMNVEKALESVTFDECDALGDLMGVVISCDRSVFVDCKPLMYQKAEDDCYGLNLDKEWKEHLGDIFEGFEKTHMVNVFVKEFEFIGSYLVIYVNGGSFDMPPLVD
jgi:hypothetical protein